MYVSIYISLYIYIYLYKYILKKECNVLRSFAKERNVLAFFYILYKRMLRSLRSFTFFGKDCCVLCILCILFCSLEKNGKERSVLLDLISHQKLEKRMLRSLKERKRMERLEWKRRRCPTLGIIP